MLSTTAKRFSPFKIMVSRPALPRRPKFYLAFIGVTLVVAIASIFQSSLIISYKDYHPSNNNPSLPVTVIINKNRAVFYNIYIPDGEHKQHALDIVKEQLGLKQKSKYLASVPLYYTLIGNNATDDIETLCAPNSECHQLRYIPEGDEGLTLQSVYEYCTQHPLSQVTYIHNKGSFHRSDLNERFRALLNRGVFSDECQSISDSSDNTCNVCASRFSSFPHFHMPGNMWTAQCSYVQHLIAPATNFADKMEDLFEWVLVAAAKDTDSSSVVIPQPTYKQYSLEYPVGRKRFAYEHWVCSHPHLEPCDVYSRRYTHGYRDLPRSFWIPRLARAPRFNMSDFLKTTTTRGEWFCGQARLLEYEYLYGLQPKPNHFLWKYYLEPYTGCETPLNRTLHNGMFRDRIGDRIGRGSEK
jgi:hypothetical protein